MNGIVGTCSRHRIQHIYKPLDPTHLVAAAFTAILASIEEATCKPEVCGFTAILANWRGEYKPKTVRSACKGNCSADLFVPYLYASYFSLCVRQSYHRAPYMSVWPCFRLFRHILALVLPD